MDVNESKNSHCQRKTISIEHIPTTFYQQAINKIEPASARQPLPSKQISQECERSSSLNELIVTKQHQKGALDAAVGAFVPTDRSVTSNISFTSHKSSKSIYDRVAAALNLSENLPAQILGLANDHRRHSAFASTTSNGTSSTDHLKSASGSSQLSSGSSYTGSMGRQQILITSTTPTSSITTAASSSSKSHVSTHVRQRLKDCVLNKRRSKDSITTSTCTGSFAPPSVGIDDSRGATMTSRSAHRDSHTTESECGIPSGCRVPQMMFAATQIAAGQKSTLFSDKRTYFGNLPPWLFIALSAGQEDRSNIDASMTTSRNTSALLRKTLSEPSLKVRGSSGGLKHKINRNDRRNVNPLAFAAAVVSSTPYFMNHSRGSRSISEAGDIGQCLGIHKAPSRLLPTLTQITRENNEIHGHSEENDNAPMEVASEAESRKIVADIGFEDTDVDMSEVKEASLEWPQLSDDSKAVQEFLSSLAMNPNAMSGGLLKATQNYLNLVREYMKQEKCRYSRMNNPTNTDQLISLSEGGELSGAGKGKQQPDQTLYRRCRQVSGLLSRTRSAPIRLTGNLGRNSFGASTSCEGASVRGHVDSGVVGGGLLSAASAMAMEAAALTSTSALKSASKSVACTGPLEEEERVKVMKQLRRKILEK